MLKEINIIFILFISLFNIISTQDNGQTSDCSSVTPDIRYDCFKYSTSKQYCCFEKINSTNSACTLINKTDVAMNPNLDCGVTEENYGLYEFEEYHPRPELDLPFLGCGEKNPEEKENCLDYSEISNSCCFFINQETGKKGCYYIGRRYSGDLEERSFKYKGINFKYECNSYFTNVNFLLVILILIIFF